MKSFEKVTPILATFAGVAAFLYSLAFFVVAKNSPVMGSVLSALFLMIFGVLVSGAWVGLYRKVREVDSSFAAWVLVLGVFGAMGAFIHGGYDLSTSLNPLTILTSDMTSQIDPRGLLTFGLSGLALILGSLLISSNKKMSKNLANLGYLAGLLSIFLYLARLIIVDISSLVIVVPALLGGFVVTPLWFVWLGRELKPRETENFEIFEADFEVVKKTPARRKRV